MRIGRAMVVAWRHVAISPDLVVAELLDVPRIHPHPGAATPRSPRTRTSGWKWMSATTGMPHLPRDRGQGIGIVLTGARPPCATWQPAGRQLGDLLQGGVERRTSASCRMDCTLTGASPPTATGSVGCLQHESRRVGPARPAEQAVGDAGVPRLALTEAS
jgi:hypothetical protein